MEHLLKRTLKNPYLRVAVGAAVLIGLTLLTNGDYNGAGMEVIGRAIAGQADPWAWVWKLLFTAITIGCGFKGGEVVPSFFVGAAFGCVAAGLAGSPGGLRGRYGAGVGVLRGGELPAGLHHPQRGAVRAPAICCISPWPAPSAI